MPMVRRHILVSTHSRLKAAGYINKAKTATEAVSTHSRPKAAGVKFNNEQLELMFQHTAARRRLANATAFILSV